jgi:hypothetical protein
MKNTNGRSELTIGTNPTNSGSEGLGLFIWAIATTKQKFRFDF